MDDDADDDDDDEVEEDVSNTMGSQHPYEEPSCVCALDLEAMYTQVSRVCKHGHVTLIPVNLS